MTATWSFAALILFAAAAALLNARRTAKQLARLSESYWELRYEQGQLASRLDRLEAPSDTATSNGPAGEARVTTAFVPLSSLKR